MLYPRRLNLRNVLPATVVATSLLVTGCSSEAPPLTKNTLQPVKLIELQGAQQGGLTQYPGKISASEHSELSFRVGGELVKLTVKAGDTVTEGDVVAHLDDRDARAQLENAQSRFDLAEVTYERMRISLERRAISRASFDEAEASYLSAKSQLARARDQLSYTVLRAPFDGIISQVPVEAYQVVGAQQTIVELQRPGSIDVTFQIPEQQVRLIQPERARMVRQNGSTFAWVAFAEQPDKKYPATYKEHDSNAAAGSLSYEVTLTLPAPDDLTILSGMSASVLLDLNALTGQQTTSWLVPTAAIASPNDHPESVLVWRYVDTRSPEADDAGGRVEAVPVTPGKKTNEGMLVRGDLSSGDRIVAAGAHLLQENSRVFPWVKEGGL